MLTSANFVQFIYVAMHLVQIIFADGWWLSFGDAPFMLIDVLSSVYGRKL